MGPSPRIRGEYGEARPSYAQTGTIPANTGRICSPRPCSRCRRDHPREYGENKHTVNAVPTVVGPSPRIRGEWLVCGRSRCNSRTIPANTGRMRPRKTVWARARDHPREYGENPRTNRLVVNVAGPSPRIRGELRYAVFRFSERRTIPANTGRMLADLRKPDQQD